MTWFRRSGSSIRNVLIGGLLLLFVLWLGTGYELLKYLAEGQSRVTEMHAAFVRGEDALTAIRTSVLLGSIYLRDALVDTSGSRQEYRDDLRTFRTDVERRITTLADDRGLAVDPAELTPLRAALDAYWETLDVFLGPNAPTTFVQGTGVLRRQVVPARRNVLSVVDRLADLQRATQRQREADAFALYSDVRRRFIVLGAVTLLVGAVVAWFVVFRVGGLERELDRRRAAEAQNRRDLERLSARLVDAQEQERRSLARELHDEVGQSMTALKMELAIALRSDELSPKLRPPLEEARTIAETTLHGVRDLSQLLHPSMLDDFGLPETLDAYARNFSKRTGIHTAVELSGIGERLPAGVEIAVYRIVQEALTNVGRHSQAEHCTVRVTCTGDILQMTVDDDGRGITGDANVPPSRGLGVIGMRERAQALAGTFLVESTPSRGTRVSVAIPLTHHAKDRRLRVG